MFGSRAPRARTRDDMGARFAGAPEPTRVASAGPPIQDRPETQAGTGLLGGSYPVNASHALTGSRARRHHEEPRGGYPRLWTLAAMTAVILITVVLAGAATLAAASAKPEPVAARAGRAKRRLTTILSPLWTFPIGLAATPVASPSPPSLARPRRHSPHSTGLDPTHHRRRRARRQRLLHRLERPAHVLTTISSATTS